MYKIRKNFTGTQSDFYVNVAIFHLPYPRFKKSESLDELPIIKVSL